MTKRLEEAFAAAAKLPARKQEALAEWVLESCRGNISGCRHLPGLKRRSASSVMRPRQSTGLDKRIHSTKNVCEIQHDGSLSRRLCSASPTDSDTGSSSLSAIQTKSTTPEPPI